MLIALVLAAQVGATAQRFEFRQPHMGSVVTITFYADDEATANRAATAAMARIGALDRRLTDYDPRSELSRLSASSPTRSDASGRWLPISGDLWTVLDAARRIGEDSDGAFDITVGHLTRLWRRARRKHQLPDPLDLAAAEQSVGFEHLQFDEAHRQVRLRKPEMRLDLGGIAKGYAADQALMELKRSGVRQALVNAAGNLALGDPPPGSIGWRIVLAPDGDPTAFPESVTLKNCGVATSGDIWQFLELDGKRYSHILDPRTGVGLTTQASATVIAPSAMLADALATTACVLGPRTFEPVREAANDIANHVDRATGERTESRLSPAFRRWPNVHVRLQWLDNGEARQFNSSDFPAIEPADPVPSNQPVR
ncbi:MAG: FAD:protein FMN transferase [Pirellulaceae bacterium]|nr:FAD:protein FMN transferase [Planctomycetales bacterium]